MPKWFSGLKRFLKAKKASPKMIENEFQRQLEQVRAMNQGNFSEEELRKLARKRAINTLKSKGFDI